MGVSFRPDDMSEGMLDDVWVKMTNPRFVPYDFEGKSERGAIPCFAFDPQDVENEDVVHRTQYYTVGSPENWEPTEDGKTLEGIGQASVISKGSGFGGFMAQAVKAGFPVDLIQEDDITFFEGVVVHLAQMPTGGKKKDGTPVTRPLPTQFKLDGGKKKGKGKAKAKSGAKASTNGLTEGVAEELGELILGAVMVLDEGGSLAKRELTQLIRDQDWHVSRKQAAVKILIKDDEFKPLCEANGLTFADGKITVAS